MKFDEKKNRRVTYSDIAQALGISKMTVSYSLRNDPRISEATRLRVQKKAAEMNYQPDPMLSALSAYRHESQTKGTKAALAWINFNKHPEQLREQKVFQLYWEGAGDAARTLGFNLEEFRWKELPLHRMHSIFKARGIRGIALAPTPQNEAPTPAELQAFPWKDYAVVRFGQSLPSLKTNFISSAQVSNTIMAFERIREKGYRRIGFAGEYSRRHLFSAGYLWAQQALPRSRRLTPLFFSEEDANQQQHMLADWMKQQKPDAVICGTRHLLQSLEKTGYRIPADLGLASMSKYDNPINAGIDQNPEEIGRTAIHALVSQLNENTFGIPTTQKEILVEGRWVDGSMLPTRK
ncbi:LacI family DNA-binding transcriptional regulator [Pontiellaceae bacterium B12227]|nr:LacI family DNA-binding transcriptional regulator [Pontiellaceae bacterium B12227]